MGARLREIADELGRLAVTPWAVDSQAAVDASDEHHTGLFRSRPGLEAALLPGLLLTHSADHIRGVAVLLAAPGVVFAPLSLIRPALESLALAHHLMDPAVDTHERVRRWANTQLTASVESLRFEDPEARSSEGREAERLLDVECARAVELGFEVGYGRKPVRGTARGRSGTPSRPARRRWPSC